MTGGHPPVPSLTAASVRLHAVPLLVRRHAKPIATTVLVGAAYLAGIATASATGDTGAAAYVALPILLVLALLSRQHALARRADHDPLTGLPNRTLFFDRLERALARARRSGRKVAVMFLDLDDFKTVNDTRGHEVGDELLVALTPRLTAALRPSDTIARFGGDEFVVLCEDLDEDQDALLIAERIAEACSGPMAVGGHEHAVTLSGGIVLVGEPGRATPSSVLRDADAAMYRAKSGGKGRIELLETPMRTRLMPASSDEAPVPLEFARERRRVAS
jgi:diguanylate cyclase (GGDEF)-like protein